MTPSQRRFAAAISHLTYTNPFLPERIEAEREALGPDFSQESSPAWSRTSTLERPNVLRLETKIESLAADLLPLFAGKRNEKSASSKDRHLYADLILYLLYYRTWKLFDPHFRTAPAELPAHIGAAYKQFLADYHHFFPMSELMPPETPEHLFSCFFQIRRAFYFIFQEIIGSSKPIVALRAAVWQSIFTCDLAAYRTTFFDKLHDIPTLITGPSGTGKELVARAIALSRYIPFVPQKQAFLDDARGLFFPLNLSALAPTLIESELFGHRKGAFTGALEDRPGYLELCPARGSVFLDEIGELDPVIQVKLLRVLQSRTYQRIGDSAARTFPGKLIAATNRDLPTEMRHLKFRPDLYYRLCADLIATPSLAEQLAESHDPEAELTSMVHFIAAKVVGGGIGDEESPAAESLTQTTMTFIREHLEGYEWPGNFRELEQCVRNILIRKHYQPAKTQETERDSLEGTLVECGLSAQELLRRYARVVYKRNGSYLKTARHLKVDRRTVKSYVS
ncbi:MAG: sigma-54 factor interaction domain-containing protein [Phycisphaerales bacterium]|nr:sigma-54 factor interaction domain-containing protein [Phycisphaerales bacterium]